MGDRRQQGSPNRGSTERGPGGQHGVGGASPPRGVQQDPRSWGGQGSEYETQQEPAPPRGASPQRMGPDPNNWVSRAPGPEVMRTMLDRIPSVPNPQAYLAGQVPVSLQLNDFVSSGEQIQEASGRTQRQRSPNRDPNELMQGNMRQAMHASRTDRAMRAHAERLEAIGIPQPAPNARSPTGAFAPGPLLPGSRVPRRDTPAPWVHVQSLEQREPQAQEMSRSPAQLLQNRPAPELPAGGAGDVLVSPEVAAALKDLKEHLLDERGHFRPTALASAYRSGIINENDQIKPTFVGWVQLSGLPCFVRTDGTAYLGHEITAQPSSSGVGGAPPQHNQTPPRPTAAGEHPVQQLRGLPTLSGGISISSTIVPPDVATKLEALRRELMHPGTDSFREEGIVDLRRFGVLNESDQISPQFIPWLKAAEIPIVFDADQKAYLGVYDGRSMRTTGLGREWASWNKIAMETRSGIEQRTPFLAAEQLLRLPSPAENIDLGRLSPSVARKVQGLKNGLLDASGQFNPQRIAELHRLGIINEHGHILPEFVPWLRAAEIPVLHDAQRNVTRLDSDAARAADYGRRNYKENESPQALARLTKLVDGAAQVQASTPPPSPDQRAAPTVSEAQRAEAAGTRGLMHPVAAEQFDRILNQFWADPGQQAAEEAGAMEVEEGQTSAADKRPGHEQEACLFGPDGARDRDPHCPLASDPHANERARIAIRQGIQADDKRFSRIARDLFGYARAAPGGNMAGRSRPREQDFESPPARRQRVAGPEPAAPGRIRAREQDFEPPPAQRQRVGSADREGGRGAAEEYESMLAIVNEDLHALELEEEADEAELLLGFSTGKQDPQPRAPPKDFGGDGRYRAGSANLHEVLFRNRLRKTVAHYKQFTAVTRMPTMARKLLGDEYAGMICEMWPNDHSRIAMLVLNKVLRIMDEITEPPNQILDEHVDQPYNYTVTVPGPDGRETTRRETVICAYFDQNQIGCQCWKRRLGVMCTDQRHPNLFKRAITVAVTTYVRFTMPFINGQPQQWRWSREHNDLFYSWLHHYGEEHVAGKQYNCVLSRERLLEFQYGTGLDYPGIAKKLNDWAAAVSGWRNGTSFILVQEEEMQYDAVQGPFGHIEVWLEKHPEVTQSAHIPAHTMMGWMAVARSQGQHHVDLDIIVEDYIRRLTLIRETNLFLEFIKKEKKHFVLRTLQEINYEIVWDERYPDERLDLPLLLDVSMANNMPDGTFFADGRGEGLTEGLDRPDGDENWPPGVPRSPDITTLGFDDE